MAAPITIPFFFECTGELTGEQYRGDFKIKARLSQRDHLQRDAIRRSLLGERPEAASAEAIVRAVMLAHLSVSIMEGAAFWKDSQGGLDLYDDDPIFGLYDKVIEEQKKVAEEQLAKAQKAKDDLRAVVKEAASAKE